MAIPNSSSISKSNLFSQTHANIFNLINTRSNVSDPADSSGARKFVYVRPPRNMGRNFAGYPFIIVPPIELAQGEGVVSGTKARTTYEIEIQIFTADGDSDSSGDPSGAEQLNTISNSVVETLNENDDTLRNYGMKNMMYDGSYDLTEDDGKTVFMRETIIVFEQLQELK